MEDRFGYQELSALLKSATGVSVDPVALQEAPDVPWDRYEVDSLGLLGLLSALEQAYGIELDGALEEAGTPRRFLEIVGARLEGGV